MSTAKTKPASLNFDLPSFDPEDSGCREPDVAQVPGGRDSGMRALETPLTTKDLVRLLHAFAHMIERLNASATAAAPRRAVRKAKAPMNPPSEPMRARARARLRRLGSLP